MNKKYLFICITFASGQIILRKKYDQLLLESKLEYIKKFLLLMKLKPK